MVIGAPSINAALTTGKPFNPEETSKEIGNLTKRVGAMQRMIGAYHTDGKHLLDPDKYDLVLQGDFAQLSQMCGKGLQYCQPNSPYKDDDVNAYLQNLKRFSEAFGQELLWAMGQRQDPLLDQKLKDARVKRDNERERILE